MVDPAVRTTHGDVRGAVRGGVDVFLGVPYAAAPVGERRFAAPEPHAGWTEAWDATGPGPTAPQPWRAFPGLDIAPLIGTGWSRGDDFLTVNVWRPEGVAEGAGLPVMVFVHGGAWVLGSNNAAVQDGAAFARSGVVFMSINYRLGVEGFLPIPGAPTNLGLRDMLAGLRWVQANAAAFGGDPGNVTVFGESAGAMSIANLVASPLAQGLFRRAIVQSGHGGMVRPLAVGRRLARRMARLLEVPCTVEGFRSRTAEEALSALEAIQAPTARIDMRGPDGLDPAFGLSRFLPVYGDDVLPEPTLDALAKGAGAEVEVLIGTNREEMNLYFVPTGVKAKMRPLIARLALGRSIRRAGDVLKAYGMGAKGRAPGDAFTEAASDLVFRWGARRFAETHRGQAHLYEFGWRSPAFGGELGACHGIELPFVFDTLACATGLEGLLGPEPPPQALADRVHALWVAFARGEPPPWPTYTAADRQVFQLEAGVAVHEPAAAAAPFLP